MSTVTISAPYAAELSRQIDELEAENDLLRKTLRMVLENQGGHQHWDSFGTNGANCPICERQQEASRQAYEVLNGIR